MADVAEPSAGHGGGDAAGEGRIGVGDERQILLVGLADDEADRRVTAPPVDEGAAVDREEVAVEERAVARDSVDDLVVHARADHAGERDRHPGGAVVEERGVAPAPAITVAARWSSSRSVTPTSAAAWTAARASATTRPASRRTAIWRGVLISIMHEY